ncbi:MAG: CRTAC1 family protein [Myxococcales bacterium]|nr:CRTAC1 family protein [Myxococcales bacterium]
MEPPPGFTVVTEAAGLAFDPGAFHSPPFCYVDDVEDADEPGDFCIPERFLGAAAAADYDGDGFPDLYLTTIDGPDHLMRNRGDGTFEEVTEAAGLTEARPTGGVAWVDVDGDRDLDLVLTALGTLRNYLYLNDGTGRFRERGRERGIAVETGHVHLGMGIGVGDYDLDGWLDLFISDWHPDDPLGNRTEHNRLLHNRGAQAPGYFEDVTEAMGIDLRGLASEVDAKAGSYGFAPAFVDLDDDGWPELTLAADFGTSRLYWNESGQRLRDETFASGVGTERNGMGSTFGDYDGDGDLDWFVSAIYTPDFPWLGNRMYRNEGQRSFLDVTDALGLRDGGWGWGTAFFDVEHDGDLDLALAAGWPSTPYANDLVRLWTNDGPGPWPDRALPLGIVFARQGRGLLPFDYDLDGDLDLLVLANTEVPALYRNDQATGHWLVVQAIGRTGNPRSLGARVRVQATADGPWQLREIGVGSHFFGQQDALAHFGLGDDEAPLHRVEIQWPASGRHEVLTDVARNQRLVVVE